MATNQTTQQTQKTNSYDPSEVYAWAQAASKQNDLSKYGIDFSQSEQDRIADIFSQQATSAYNQAQNQYSQDIANQQATLSDTIRRSQAEAVATGASRGMQAANELSSILGLQQAAAQGATQLQSDYATQLASARQQAMEMQNQRNQVGAELATADLNAEAQKYAANLDYAANDFNRILSEYNSYVNNNNSSQANALLKAYLAANGLTSEDINSVMSELGATDIVKKDWTVGNDGLLANVSVQTNDGNHTDVNYTDLENGKTESGNISMTINGKKMSTYVEWSGNAADSGTAAKLNNLAGNSPVAGSIVYYGGKMYIYSGSTWHASLGRGKGASSAGNYDKFMAALKGNK